MEVKKKTCTKCDDEKDLSEFTINKRYKYGVVSICKKCKCIEAKERYKNDKVIALKANELREKRAFSRKQYYQNNKEKRDLYTKKYRAENAEKCKKYNESYKSERRYSRKKLISNLGDSYISELISKSYGVERDNIHPSIIETKTLLLQIKRELR